MKIKIVIADDEELFRVGIAHILSRDGDIELQYQAENGDDLVSYLDSCATLPNIVMTDIKMPGLNGVEATKIISSKFPSVSVIALTTYKTGSFIRNMIDVGASGYLVKNATPTQVLHTIKQVFFKGFYYDDETMRLLNEDALRKHSSIRKSPFDSDFITEREQEVLELICQQYTSKEISEKLFISVRTVEKHRKNLFEKTDVKNVTGLVLFAINNNLVTIIPKH